MKIRLGPMPSWFLRRRWSKRLQQAAVVLLAFVVPLPLLAATCTVTSTADDGSAGTLRWAIAQANAGTCTTINFNLPFDSTITLTQGSLAITSQVAIAGTGAQFLLIDGAKTSQVFSISPTDYYANVPVSISGVTIQNGLSTGWGGAIVSAGAALTISGVVFTNNSAVNGGAIFHYSGPLTITNSTFSGNSASNGGGAIWNNGNAPGDVINSTFVGNSGGAVVNEGNMTMVNSTLTGNPGGAINLLAFNSYSSLTLKNTLLANGPSGGNCAAGSAVVTSAGHNLSDDSSCTAFFTALGDVNNTPAGLDPNGLQWYGVTGFGVSNLTPTIALSPTSPALNAVPVAPTNYCTDLLGNALGRDQRSGPRPSDFACDIGAYELQTDTDFGVAVVNGPNTFTGNQTINGNVAASVFFGDGSGLTNLSPANIAPGTAAINISGNAATATSASSATIASSAATAQTATNALSLNGVQAGNYARLDIGNNFSGDQGVTGNLSVTGNSATGGSITIGNGTPIVSHTSVVIPNVSYNMTLKALECTTWATSLPIAEDSDTVVVGIPSALMNGSVLYSAWVNGGSNPGSTGQVIIRFCNPTNKPTALIGSGSIRIDLWKH